MNPTLSHLITRFFISYLANERGISQNTIESYSDTLRLLIKHLCKKHSKQPEDLGVEMLDPEAILNFLDHLERDRNNSPATRNQRLAAIKSFFHYAARENPELMQPNERIQAIRPKKTDHKPPPSLTVEHVHAILDAIDTTNLIGLRDKALIQLLYNTGARVQEIADLRISDLRFETPSTVTLTGKGRKIRTVPLWEETVQHIQAYLLAREHGGIQSNHLFLNNKGQPITRFGLGRRVELHGKNAAEKYSELKDLKVTPHVFRHTTALHLIETGSDITIVKEWLGHADIKTTSQYIEVSVARKRDALEKLPPPGSGEPVEMPEWKEPGILEFLMSLSGSRTLCCERPTQRTTGVYSDAHLAT
ncbi:MAG: site-specific integrase [Verrucomicrobia bacterium]|nr:site-specific integrase [Verrucomicrobiota bacterium]